LRLSALAPDDRPGDSAEPREYRGQVCLAPVFTD